MTDSPALTINDTIRNADRLVVKVRARHVVAELEKRLEKLALERDLDAARELIRRCDQVIADSRRTVSTFPVEHRRSKISAL